MSSKTLVFLYVTFCLIQGESNFNIVVPEFICGKNGEQKDSKTDTTIIGFEGEAKLDFKVGLKRMSKACRNTQRCNLIAWKVIRDFEKYLNTYPYRKANSIEFNNTMLVPGLEYVLSVFVTQGNTREQKQVVLNFVDEDFIRAADKPIASIRLVGVPSSVAHMAYVLHAEVNICSNISDYYFRWELFDGKNFLNKLVDRSSELTIPPFTFREAKNYIIQCNLVNMENNKPFAKATLPINMKAVGESLVVKLPMLYTTIQVQQPINIRPYVVDLENQDEDIKMEWSCAHDNKDMCQNKYGDELNIEGGFIDEGEYNISVKVTKGSVVKFDSCLVKVMKEVPSIEIDTIESPILPSSGVTIKAIVNDLRTFCTVQWRLEEGPDSFQLIDIPGNVDAPYKVYVTKDLFLNELEEFSSDVISKEFNLVIPPPSGSWPGLPNSGENYHVLFRLEVKCPEAQLQDNDIEIDYSADMLNDTITVWSLVTIDVNVAPQAQPLEVAPSTGVALHTVFSFQTRDSPKFSTDYPLLYKFGYLLGDREFIFCNMLGFRKTETILPFADTGVRTFLEVCDSFNSCGKIFGPTIKTTMPEKINEENVLRIFNQQLNGEDYYKAFGYASTVLYTCEEEEEEQFRENFSNGVYNKIQYMLNSYGDDEEWSKRVNKLITNISEFDEELTFSDKVLNGKYVKACKGVCGILEAVSGDSVDACAYEILKEVSGILQKFDGLVELRSKLLAAQKAKLIFSRRQLLEVNKKITFENFKSYLEVSDLIITSSTDQHRIESEKKHLSQKIEEYMGELCVELYEKQQRMSLELKSVIFVVEKLPKKSFNNFHTIPSEGNPWNTTAEIKINAQALDKVSKDNLCIVKTAFRDFFNKPGVAYGAKVLNGNDGSLVSDLVDNILLMPVDKEQTVDINPKCLVYEDGWKADCKFTDLLPKYAQCSCKTLGTFSLAYEDKLVITTTVTTIGDNKAPESTTKGTKVTGLVTNDQKTTPKAPPGQPYTTPTTELTADGNVNNKTVETVGQKPNSLSPDLDTNKFTKDVSANVNDEVSTTPATQTPQSKGTGGSAGISSQPELTTHSVATRQATNIVTQPSATETREATSSANSTTNENIPTAPSVEANPPTLSTESPAADSGISTKTDTSTQISVTSPVLLTSSAIVENATKSVGLDIGVNIATDIPLTSTTKVVKVEPAKDEDVPDIGSKISTVGMPTIVQFLTPPTSGVFIKNVTNGRKPEDDTYRGGFIQGGINANFNTGFSVNFYLNTTHK